MTPTTKTRHTLRIINALTGIRPGLFVDHPLVKMEPLPEGGTPSFNDMVDTHIAAPELTSMPEFWELQGRFEAAIKDPDRTHFPHTPITHWRVGEGPGIIWGPDFAPTCRACKAPLVNDAGEPCKCLCGFKSVTPSEFKRGLP